MMHRLLMTISFGILLMLCFSTLDAQYEVEWASQRNNKIERNATYKLLGIVGDRYYAISERNENRLLYTYDLNHNLIEEEDWNFFSKNRDYRIQEIITTPSDTFFYIHELSQQHKEWIIYVCRYRDGKFTDPEEIYFEKYEDVARSRLSDMFNNYGAYVRKNGGIVMSPDSTKLAFVNVVMPSSHNQDEIVSVVVWDSGLQESWRASYDYNMSNDRFDIKSIKISNDGIVYALAELEKDLELDKGIVPLKRKNLPRTQYVVYRIDRSGIVSNNISIDKKNGIVEAGLFFKDKSSSDFVIAGFYSDGTKSYRMSGLFWSECSADLEHTGMKLHAFEKEIWKNMSHDYVIEEGLFFDNGSTGFVSENYEVRIVNNNNGFNRNAFGVNNFRSFSYYSGELVIPRFSSTGELIHTFFIQKNYDSPVSASTSYAMAYDGYQYYIMFNDTKRKKQAKATGMKGRQFTDMIVLTSSGEISSDVSLFSEREEDVLFSPYLFCTDNEHIAFGGFRNGRMLVGKIKL